MAELLSGGLASCGIAYGFMEWFIHPFSRRMFHEIAAIRANPLEFRQAVTTTDNEDAVDILCEIASLDHLPLISRIQEWVASGFDRLPPSYDSLTAVLLNYRNYLADQALKRQKQVQSIIHSISSPEDVVPLMPVHLSGPKIAEIAETVFAKFDELRTRYIERPNDLEDLLSNKENVHPVVHTLLVNLYQGALPGTICFLANAVDDPKSLPGIWLSQLDAKKS
jgi:hypothetical protein